MFVRDPCIKGLYFFQVSSDKHLLSTVIPSTVHPAQPSWLLETLFLRVSIFFKVSSDGHLWWAVINTTVNPPQPSWLSYTLDLRVSIFVIVLRRTYTTHHHTLDGSSYTTVITVRDPSMNFWFSTTLNRLIRELSWPKVLYVRYRLHQINIDLFLMDQK